MARIWKVTSRVSGAESHRKLKAVWEVELGSMSDNYTPSEISALDLLGEWAKQAQEKYPDGLIPIRWYVVPPIERMPFQYHDPPGNDENFLTHFLLACRCRDG